MKKQIASMILVVLVVLFAAGGLAVPLYVRARTRSRMLGCAANLSQLWKLEWVCKAQYGGRKPFLRATGKEFWLALSKTTPPLIEPGEAEIYWCPFRGRGMVGQTHYLGPRIDVNSLSETDPVGCDEPFNHSPDGSEGGHVLRKSGDVFEFTGDEWLQFVRDGCVP